MFAMHSKKSIMIVFASFGLGCLGGGCSSKVHKAESKAANLNNPDAVTGGETIEVKNGNMVVQKKTAMSENFASYNTRFMSVRTAFMAIENTAQRAFMEP